MATTSFTKHFVVKDPNAVKALVESFERPQKVVITTKRNLEKDNKRGIESLKRKLSNFDLN